MGAAVSDLIASAEVVGRRDWGTFGEVLRCRPAGGGATLVVRVVPLGAEHTETDVRHLARELRAVTAVNHPAILGLIAEGAVAPRGAPETPGHLPYSLAFRDVECQTLAARMVAGPMGTREALEVARTVAEALAVAHARQIVHRGLEPGSVLVTAEGTRLPALGLVPIEPLRKALRDERTVAEVTPFTAPEVARGEAEKIGPATDVYGVGALLFFMLTGAPPVPETGGQRLYLAIAEGEPPRLRERNPHLSSELEAVVFRCLERDPLRRYADTGPLAKDLGAILQGLSTSLGRASMFRSMLRAAERIGLGGRMAVAWTFAVAAVLAGLAALYVRERKGTSAAGPPERAGRTERPEAAALRRARAALEGGRAAEAVEILRSLAAGGPVPAEIHAELGRALLETGAAREAVERLATALAADPALTRARLLRAIALEFGLEDRAAAEVEIARLAAGGPAGAPPATAVSIRARACASGGDAPGAAAALADPDAERETSWEARLLRASARLTAGDPELAVAEAALRDLARALDEGPVLPGALALRARAHEVVKDPVAAQADRERAEEIRRRAGK